MAFEYVLLKYEDDEIVACECCGMPVPTAEFNSRMDMRRMHRLCEVCTNSYISLGFHYGIDGYPYHPIAVIIAQCTNMILTAIKESRK